jgi:capsular polysaccharide biosynthesis protein
MMSVGDVLDVLRRRWLFVLAVVSLMAALAGAMTLSRPPSYTASVRAIVSVSSPQTKPPYVLASGSQFIIDRMTSYAQLGDTTRVLGPVVSSLHLAETPATLTGRVTSRSILETALLEISVTYNDPAMAAKIADETVRELGRTVESFENHAVTVKSAGPVSVPSASWSSRLIPNVGLGIVIGLIVGLGLVILHASVTRSGERESRDD